MPANLSFVKTRKEKQTSRKTKTGENERWNEEQTQNISRSLNWTFFSRARNLKLELKSHCGLWINKKKKCFVRKGKHSQRLQSAFWNVSTDSRKESHGKANKMSNGWFLVQLWLQHVFYKFHFFFGCNRNSSFWTSFLAQKCCHRNSFFFWKYSSWNRNVSVKVKV